MDERFEGQFSLARSLSRVMAGQAAQVMVESGRLKLGWQIVCLEDVVASGA